MHLIPGWQQFQCKTNPLIVSLSISINKRKTTPQNFALHLVYIIGFSHYIFDSIYGRTLPCNMTLSHRMSVGQRPLQIFCGSCLTVQGEPPPLLPELFGVIERKRPEVHVNGHEFRLV